MSNAAFKNFDQLRKGRDQAREDLKRRIKASSDAVTKQREITATAETELREHMEALKAFDKEFPATAEASAPPAPASQTRVGRGKRGPAKKAAAKAPKVAAKTASKTPKKAAAKAPKKVAAKTAGKNKPGPKKGNKQAARGREEVDSGKRPPIKHAICHVLGDKQMNAQQIYDAIDKKGWLPASNNARAYIGNILSAQKDVFPPVQRGIYRRADNWEELLGPETRGAKKAAAAKTPATKAAKNGNGHKAETKKDDAPAATSTETVVKAETPAAPAPAVAKDILEEASAIFTPAQA